MTELFPRVSATARGYAIEQVDAFFDRARHDYEGSVSGEGPAGAADTAAQHPEEASASGSAASPLDAAAVRVAAFDLVRHGYSPAAVDSALLGRNDAWSLLETSSSRPKVGPPTAAPTSQTSTTTAGSNTLNHLFLMTFLPSRRYLCNKVYLWWR